METINTNKKAKYDYEFIDSYSVGIVLTGSELKPIRNRNVSMVDSFCFFNNGELYVKNLTIASDGKVFTHIPNRDRKLLLKKKELKKLSSDLKDGLSLIPYKVFINDKGIVKLDIKLAKGKKTHNKKETIKERDILKNTLRDLKK